MHLLFTQIYITNDDTYLIVEAFIIWVIIISPVQVLCDNNKEINRMRFFY